MRSFIAQSINDKERVKGVYQLNDKKVDHTYYVIQRRESRTQAYVELPDPETVALLDPKVLRQNPRDVIFSANVVIPGLERTVRIDASEVKEWDIRDGSRVTFEPPGDIVAVNGIRDRDVIKKLPIIEGEDARLSKYASRHLPIEMFGERNMRIFTMRSPLTFGVGHGIISDGGDGKSFLFKKIYEQLLILNPFFPNLHVIYSLIDEKGQDGADIVDLHRKYGSPENFELFLSPRSQKVRDVKSTERHMAHFQTFAFATSRALEMARFKDVVALCDNPGRAVRSNSMAGLGDKELGMVGGGMYNSSIDDIANLIGITGEFFHDGGSLSSLTNIVTLLKTEGRTAMSAFYEEVAKNLLEGEWVLWPFKSAFPRIDPSKCFTRALERLPNKALLRELDLVENLIFPPGDFSKGRNGRAHTRLLKRQEEVPMPLYMRGTPIYEEIKKKNPDLLQY